MLQLELVPGFLILLLTALISLRYRLLSFSGCLASSVIGIIFLIGGWKYLALLYILFIVAMTMTKLKSEKKKMRSIVDWSTTRDWKNVVANGGVATSFVILERIFPLEIFIAGFLGAISATCADTLASELGILYPKNPRLMMNLRKEVPPGVSGAVSILGEIAMLLGGLIIGFSAWVISIYEWTLLKFLIITLASGSIACTFDSILGCSIQASYRCSVCRRLTEENEHCGKPAIHLKGYKFISNHVVNLLSTMVGALTAIFTSYAFRS